jgi:hypothetical protein
MTHRLRIQLPLAALISRFILELFASKEVLTASR